MADTFAHGRLANHSPFLPEFFETFHVVMHPLYVSKYFPAEGLFLLIGQKMNGRPAVGVWLSSSLACVAAYWMLLAWSGSNGAMIGALLWMFQYGLFSYWSQSYWGGMVAALGGAFVFGAGRRLWDDFCWRNSIWLGVGVVVLANSRPLEGILALLPGSALFLSQLWRERLWKRSRFVKGLLLPLGLVLVFGAFLTCFYNRAITGSAWKPPHLLHEEQYEETPEFLFLPAHSQVTYSSPWLEYLYGHREVRTYEAQRALRTLPKFISHKLVIWWSFYCGIVLTPALLIPGLLRRGWIRRIQAGLITLLPLLWFLSGQETIFLRTGFILLAVAQIILIWFVFDEVWQRLAIVTVGLLVFESFTTKWFFPHYSAPVACLILYLQVEGLRRMWHWSKQVPVVAGGASRKERRKMVRDGRQEFQSTYPLRGFVSLLPVALLLSLAVRVEARRAGWSENFDGPDRAALLMNDWSVRRAELQRWLDQQPSPQLVFVSYTARHNVNFEWVYNDADLPNSKVVWARDLGPEHNKQLLNALPGRTVWSLEADSLSRQLVPYTEHAAPPLPYWLNNDQNMENDR